MDPNFSNSNRWDIYIVSQTATERLRHTNSLYVWQQRAFTQKSYLKDSIVMHYETGMNLNLENVFKGWRNQMVIYAGLDGDPSYYLLRIY